MKDNVSSMIDLDLALEEVAKKLRPTADLGVCGNTYIYHTNPYITEEPSPQCSCPCCSGQYTC